ncbi:MAG TPA: preprotein translocase subunit SecG [Chthonomonadaceae bacterium]|nr:preprotein translocase subunit SecG [Chthonomonadaceae bacterium]
MQYIYLLLCFLQAVLGLALIIVVTSQESKNEGLTGQIGSTTTGSFKGMAGREERLNLLARNIGIAFFVVSVLVAYGTNRWYHF